MTNVMKSLVKPNKTTDYMLLPVFKKCLIETISNETDDFFYLKRI